MLIVGTYVLELRAVNELGRAVTCVSGSLDVQQGKSKGILRKLEEPACPFPWVKEQLAMQNIASIEHTHKCSEDNKGDEYLTYYPKEGDFNFRVTLPCTYSSAFGHRAPRPMFQDCEDESQCAISNCPTHCWASSCNPMGGWDREECWHETEIHDITLEDVLALCSITTPTAVDRAQGHTMPTLFILGLLASTL